jgi:CheY-like chemotaxis protein
MVAIQERTRVLVVDHNKDSGEVLAMLLQAQGYEPLAVSDPSMAIDGLRHFAPHIAVLDLAMPQINGLDLAKAFRQLPGFENLPLIALTGLTEPKLREQASEAGFNRYLLKPFEFDQLNQVLRALLRVRDAR